MDFQILYFINQFHCEILDKIMVVITHMGTKGIFWILVGVTILLFKQTRKCGLTVELLQFVRTAQKSVLTRIIFDFQVEWRSVSGATPVFN